MIQGRREFVKKSVYGVLALLGFAFLIPGVKLLTPVGRAGKETVLTSVRVAMSIFETVSASRSGVKPNRPSGVR